MRRAARIDRTQPEIVQAFRALGASVQHLHTIGKGCPDIAVSFGGVTHFIEIKDGALPPSRRRLTDDETDWHAATRGTVHVVASLADVQAVFGRLRKEAIAIKVMDMHDERTAE